MVDRILIVDENDQPIGVSTREEAFATGLYYRLVRIVLRDDGGNFLLQKRSLNRPLYPGRWTSAASGHVDEGETNESSASRELAEEVGVETPLTFVGKFLVHDKEGDKIVNQFNVVFEGCIPRSTKISPQSDEVSEIRWFTLNELQKRIANNPDDFTPALIKSVQEYYR